MRILPAVVLVLLLAPTPSPADDPAAASPPEALPTYLRDRGPGVPTSMFGQYVLPGELLFYPFVEYYRDRNAEYSPQELGYGLDQDFRGDFEATEYLVFLGYGLKDDLSVEVEAAYNTTAELEKSPSDPTAMPVELTESGLGDVQTQVSWMWQKETSRRPAFFSYAEVAFPFQASQALIGTSDWEFKAGTGVIRGFSWGTTTLLAAVEYEAAENAFGLGEVALQYLKKLSPALSLFGSVEGKQDEWELITEALIGVSGRASLILNSSVGLTSKASGWAPEVGIAFRF